MKYTIYSDNNDCTFPELSFYYIPRLVTETIKFLKNNFPINEMGFEELDEFANFVYGLEIVTDDEKFDFIMPLVYTAKGAAFGTEIVDKLY